MTVSRKSGFWSSLAELYDIFEPEHRRQIGVLVALTIAGAFSEVLAIGAVVPFLMFIANAPSARLPLIDSIFGAVGSFTPESKLLAATALLCIAAVGAGILRVMLVRKTQDLVYAFGHRLSVEVQRRMLLQPYSWHVGHNSSQQLATIEKVEVVTGAVLLPLTQALAALVLIVVVVIVLLQIAPLATVLVGGTLGAAYYGLGLLARTRLEVYSAQIDTAFEERIRILQEGLGGIRDLILDGSQATVVNRFRTVDLTLAQARAKAVYVSALPRYLIEPIGIITIAGLALFLSARAGGLIAALPILGALALGAQRLLPLVQQLFQGWSSVRANRHVMDDVVTRLRLPLSKTHPSAGRLSFQRVIEVRDVSYTYADRAHAAVTDLSFDIRHGSRVALVGPTGSGKSTTADLLMGLLEPNAGRIMIDGIQLSGGNQQAWQANIAHVPQTLFLADATIAQNIALTAEVDFERLFKAARLAELDRFVTTLPDGYDTLVGERGVRMSGGQRQRLAIARAIYKQAPLFVFDEATSALDDATERAILDALDALQEEGCTIVIIAHRSGTTVRCDNILRLEQGRLV